jgi:proton-dependent oligopeptide transporter, POT family
MTWLWVAVACAACLGLFVVFFKIRQSIQQDDGFLAVMFYSVGALLRGGKSDPPSTKATSDETHPITASAMTEHWFFGPAARRFGRDGAEGPAAVLRIMSIFIFISVFWALFDQHSSTWIEQAKQMNRVVDFSTTQWVISGGLVGAFCALAIGLTVSSRGSMRLLSLLIGVVLGGISGLAGSFIEPFELQPDQIPAANPFLVMVLIPYTSFGLYPLTRALGLEPTPLRRMTLGMFVAGLSFAYVALLQNRLDAGESIHVVWQLIGYIVITVAEVMISITGLEFAYSQAPKRMKSVIMGFWLFNVTLGNVLVAFIARGQQQLEKILERPIPLEQFFWVFAGLMVLAAIAFGIRAAFYQYTDYSQ